jgi:cyclopropane-fatty-acyl-phospholipid synthase
MSSREEVAVSYDISNDFFRLWLDERMNYTCAVYQTGMESLEAAQEQKLAWIHDAAHVAPDKRVVDLGCGWGANLRYLTHDRGVRQATGVTLSEAQARYIRQAGWRGVTVEHASVKEWSPPHPFDAIISIGMLEHFASREDTAEGRHVEIYRDLFRRAWEWSTPGAHFALHHIIAGKPITALADLRDMVFLCETIFPGACAPQLATVLECLAPYWEVIKLVTRRDSYARTTAEWLRRMRAREAEIKGRWGPSLFADYERYLGWCVRMFEGQLASLVQMSLRRIDA